MVTGVLALQGGFQAHLRLLAPHAVEVRNTNDLTSIDRLILPGGESTAQHKLIEAARLLEPLCRFVESGKPVFATCAGLILCARFGWLDVSVKRNAYGRQLDSFEALDDAGSRHLVFIRAPRIGTVGPQVQVLATLRGEPILVSSKNVTAACYHPELSTHSSEEYLRSIAWS